MTGTTTVRISRRARAHAEAVAAAINRSMASVIEDAVDAYRREVFWHQYAEGIARLLQDPQAWADYAGEREAEAGTLPDGLGSE